MPSRFVPFVLFSSLFVLSPATTAQCSDAVSGARAYASHNWQQRVLAVRIFGARADARALARALQDRHPLVRRAACEEMGPLGSGAAPVIEDLASSLEDSDREVRAAAALALGWTRVRADVAIRALLAAVDARSDRVRTNVVTSLGELRGTTHDEAIVRALTVHLGDKSPFVRDAATRSLSWVLRDTPQLAPVTFDALRATDWRARARACHALGAALRTLEHSDASPVDGGLERSVRAALCRASRDTYVRVRNAAAIALASR
ncbi:MAG: HEAT repeat domain-containing protein [Planctomycetes bacterium]|nr:HEAT repeat domain-containing protein [Planctomycetota bacterium]